MDNILTVDSLSAGYGSHLTIKDISFSLKRGEIIGIVGESGCGKSTLLKAIMQQRDSGVRTFSGHIILDGCFLESMNRESLRKILGTEIGMVFQNPSMSFNAIRSYRNQFCETLKSHGLYEKGKSEEQILDIFERLQLYGGEDILNSCPYEMSGGMNQRIAIAMAMLLQPKVLLADEPTSALDVTVQLQVVEELLRLREEYQTSIVLVTHNIGVVRKMADRVAILYAGRIVEYGDCRKVLSQPVHPYTRALLEAVPELGKKSLRGLDGNPPANGAEIDTCAFAERCCLCNETCRSQKVQLQKVDDNHWSGCTRIIRG